MNDSVHAPQWGGCLLPGAPHESMVVTGRPVSIYWRHALTLACAVPLRGILRPHGIGRLGTV